MNEENVSQFNVEEYPQQVFRAMITWLDFEAQNEMLSYLRDKLYEHRIQQRDDLQKELEKVEAMIKKLVPKHHPATAKGGYLQGEFETRLQGHPGEQLPLAPNQK